VDTSAFHESVRRLIEDAMQTARARPSDAGAAGKLGMALHAHDQFDAAVICYQRAVALDPGRAPYFYYQGAALSAQGKHAEAVAPLTRAAALVPDSIPVRMRLAEALLESGETVRSGKEYRTVIRQDPSVAAAHYGVARTLRGEPAIAAYSKALELFPRYGAAQFSLAAEYRKAGRTDDAERALRGYEENRTFTPPLDDPLLAAVYALNTGATGMIRRAQALEREGRLAEAAEVCERITEQYPKFEQAWINLVSLYGRLNDAQKIGRAYSAAVALAPERGEIYYNYGVFCLGAGRLRDAQEAFQKVTGLDPRNADGWNNLAAVVERSGALDKAAEYYRKAIALRPDARASRFGLGRIYASQRRYPDAIAELEKTIQPEDEYTPGYLYALGAVHARAGHRQQSIGLLRKAREQASARGQTSLAASIGRDMRMMGVNH
jgi:tetratricopeptide (TPR) repeat protein